LKDSGIEWLGNIPKEWNIGKAKRFVNITNGTDPKTNGMIPVYGSGKIPFKTCGEFKNGPVVLLGRKGSIKTPNYVEGKYWNVDTAFDVKVISQKLLIKFYYYLAICFDYDSYITQTAIPSITQTDYENIYLPIPNTDEQVAIITYLDTKCATIDNAIVQKEKNIKVLNELKTRLISDVVTGKIDVRDIKVPEYEFIAEESLDEADASEDEMGSEVEEN
jgi:type I restriction enzyme S subunit